MLLKLDSFLDSGSILDDFSNFTLNLTTLPVLAADARGHNCIILRMVCRDINVIMSSTIMLYFLLRINVLLQ